MVKHGIISTNFKAFAGVDTMDEFIKELEPNLDYLEHKIIGNEVIIYAASNRKICRCPYCGSESARIHSRYEKSFQDLPIMGKKTKVVIENFFRSGYVFAPIQSRNMGICIFFCLRLHK